jgi:hypothetical protein
MRRNNMKEETKSTIKLIAAIVIVMFVFNVLSGDPATYSDQESYTDEEIDAAFDKIVKVSEDSSIEETEEQSEEQEEIDEFAEYRAKKVELSAGYHNVGRDGKINPGTYRVYAKSGFGLITGDLWQGYLSETVGYNRSTCVTEKINKIFLTKEDSFKIEGRCVLVFDPIE